MEKICTSRESKCLAADISVTADHFFSTSSGVTSLDKSCLNVDPDERITWPRSTY